MGAAGFENTISGFLPASDKLTIANSSKGSAAFEKYQVCYESKQFERNFTS